MWIKNDRGHRWNVRAEDVSNPLEYYIAIETQRGVAPYRALVVPGDRGQHYKVVSVTDWSGQEVRPQLALRDELARAALAFANKMHLDPRDSRMRARRRKGHRRPDPGDYVIKTAGMDITLAVVKTWNAARAKVRSYVRDLGRKVELFRADEHGILRGPIPPTGRQPAPIGKPRPVHREPAPRQERYPSGRPRKHLQTWPAYNVMMNGSRVGYVIEKNKRKARSLAAKHLRTQDFELVRVEGPPGGKRFNLQPWFEKR